MEKFITNMTRKELIEIAKKNMSIDGNTTWCCISRSEKGFVSFTWRMRVDLETGAWISRKLQKNLGYYMNYVSDIRLKMNIPHIDAFGLTTFQITTIRFVLTLNTTENELKNILRIFEDTINSKYDKEHKSVYLCPVCFKNMFESGNDNEDIDCNEHDKKCIEIDKPMEDIIRGFNLKGYKTEFCCGSHGISNTHLYVLFHDNYPDIEKYLKDHKDIDRYFDYRINGNMGYDRSLLEANASKYTKDIIIHGFVNQREIRIQMLKEMVGELPYIK